MIDLTKVSQWCTCSEPSDCDCNIFSNNVTCSVRGDPTRTTQRKMGALGDRRVGGSRGPQHMLESEVGNVGQVCALKRRDVAALRC